MISSLKYLSKISCIIALLLIISNQIAFAKDYYYLYFGKFPTELKAETLSGEVKYYDSDVFIKSDFANGSENNFHLYCGPYYSMTRASAEKNMADKNKKIAKVKILKKKYKIWKNKYSLKHKTQKVNDTWEEGNVVDFYRKNAANTHVSIDLMIKRFLYNNRGRNIGRGRLGVGLKHTFSETETGLDRRTLRTVKGSNVTESNQTVGDTDSEGYFSTLHTDALTLRFGITDYLEINGEAGTGYTEVGNLNYLFGMGVRLNLFEYDDVIFKNNYMALELDYNQGTFEDSYSSDVGENFDKTTDWVNYTVKLEAGTRWQAYWFYIGGAYSIYTEDVERELKSSTPSGFDSYQFIDEMEGVNKVHGFGGVEVAVYPEFSIILEAEYGNRKGIMSQFELKF